MSLAAGTRHASAAVQSSHPRRGGIGEEELLAADFVIVDRALPWRRDQLVVDARRLPERELGGMRAGAVAARDEGRALARLSIEQARMAPAR